ncbi:MAG: hypothetical protein E6Q97_28740 [Desulfurellales bacterium]|nr:MAG: hypothetical protein E6Q97_28740 [Desulfurellales bacterium]
MRRLRPVGDDAKLGGDHVGGDGAWIWRIAVVVGLEEVVVADVGDPDIETSRAIDATQTVPVEPGRFW